MLVKRFILTSLFSLTERAIYLSLFCYIVLPVFIFFAYTSEPNGTYSLASNYRVIVWVSFAINFFCFVVYVWAKKENLHLSQNQNDYRAALRQIKISYLLQFILTFAFWIILFWGNKNIRINVLYAGNSVWIVVELVLCLLLLRKIILQLAITTISVADDGNFYSKLYFAEQLQRKKRSRQKFRKPSFSVWNNNTIEVPKSKQTTDPKRSKNRSAGQLNYQNNNWIGMQPVRDIPKIQSKLTLFEKILLKFSGLKS